MTSIGQHTAWKITKNVSPRHYDLFIFDVRMSPLLGTELAEELKQESPGTNIILAFEDAVDKEASPEEWRQADAEVRTRPEEVTALIERLRWRRCESARNAKRR